jgi:acetoin utilization protein AcuB
VADSPGGSGYGVGAMRRATISDWMSRHPEEIDRRDGLEAALQLMRDRGIHHLPVMDGGHLYGIVSSRDLDVVLTAVGTPTELAVGDVCARNVYTVGPTTSLSEVAREMMERHLGSVVVVDAGVVVGIFTLTDALRAIVATFAP